MTADFFGRDQAAARETLTVSALNRAVAGLLSRGFPLVRVSGEISGLNRAASGHWYFVLKDDIAQVRCVMFRGRNALVRISPRDGDAVVVVAQVALYEARGEYQLTIEALELAGPGRLFERFVRLRDRLAAEGLFDQQLKRPLPALPAGVGVVTSLQAASLRDVVTTLRRRSPYCRVIVYPVPVQGEGAADRIASMIGLASSRAEVDALLLVRGGGSLEDLWAFNEEAVARAIRAARLPVVVGVGHESDFTIADFAADLRAPTPTAAAEMVAPASAALVDGVNAQFARLRRCWRSQAGAIAQRLDYAIRALAAPRAPLAGIEARLDTLRARAATARPRVAALRVRVDAARGAMRNTSIAALSAGESRTTALARALSHLDPHAVLGRGYSIVRDAGGALVRSAAGATIGQRLAVTLAQGALEVRVEGKS